MDINLVGDTVIEPPFDMEVLMKYRTSYAAEVFFFESGKVLFFEEFAYAGGDLNLYESVKDFEDEILHNHRIEKKTRIPERYRSGKQNN